MRDLIFVAGMHRSGTSAMTRLLALCGAGLPVDLVPPAPDNPTGFWEPEEGVRLNDRFLRSRNSSWYEPFLLHAKPDDERDFVAEIADFLERCFAGESTCVLKDPRICLIFELWLEAAERANFSPKIVATFRNPDEVAASLKARQGLATEHSKALWLNYNLEIERCTRHLPRIFIGYDDLVENPERVLRRCIEELDLALDVSNSAKSRMRAFIDPKLHHQKAPSRDPDDPTPGRWVTRVYAALRAGAQENRLDASELCEIYTSVEALNRFYHTAVLGAQVQQTHDIVQALQGELAEARQAAEAARNDLDAVRADLHLELEVNAKAHASALEQAHAEARHQAEVASTRLEALQAEHGAERSRLYRIAQTLRALVLDREAELDRLNTQAKSTKVQVVELTAKWADAEFQRRCSQSEADVARAAAHSLRERLFSAELKRNRLFGELQFVREQRDELGVLVEQLQGGLGPEEPAVPEEATIPMGSSDADIPSDTADPLPELEHIQHDVGGSADGDREHEAESQYVLLTSGLRRIAGRGRRLARRVVRRALNRGGS